MVQFSTGVPPTRYRTRTWDGIGAIEAQAHGSTALLARSVEVNLLETPVLCWRWRIDAPVRNADMARPEAHDFAARLYVAFKLPAETMTWATRLKLATARTLFGDQLPDAALNYVWDNRYPEGTRRPHIDTDRITMVVLRSGAKHAGTWVSERRNVLEDLRQALGAKDARLAMVALATDSDNTGEEIRAGYADLHFVAADRACV